MAVIEDLIRKLLIDNMGCVTNAWHIETVTKRLTEAIGEQYDITPKAPVTA